MTKLGIAVNLCGPGIKSITNEKQTRTALFYHSRNGALIVLVPVKSFSGEVALGGQLHLLTGAADLFLFQVGLIPVVFVPVGTCQQC